MIAGSLREGWGGKYAPGSPARVRTPLRRFLRRMRRRGSDSCGRAEGMQRLPKKSFQIQKRKQTSFFLAFMGWIWWRHHISVDSGFMCMRLDIVDSHIWWGGSQPTLYDNKDGDFDSFQNQRDIMFADASTLIHTNYSRVLYLPPLQTFRAFIYSVSSSNFNLCLRFYVLFLQSVIKHSHLIYQGLMLLNHILVHFWLLIVQILSMRVEWSVACKVRYRALLLLYFFTVDMCLVCDASNHCVAPSRTLICFCAVTSVSRKLWKGGG